MPIPTTISDLNATAASNSPGGSENVFPDLDNYLRAHAAFIRQIWNGDLGTYLQVTSDGRLYGTALHNNAGSVTGTTNQYVVSGTYTPTLTNTTNIAASTANACQWIRVGNVVHVSGSASADPTTANALIRLDLTLPIASNFTANTQLRGTCARFTSGGQYLAGIMYADTTGDAAILQAFCDSDATDNTWSFTFTYVVL